MKKITASSILDVTLAAADQATLDSDEHDLTAREVGLLNEQWIHSYVGDAISRHLQNAYGGDHCRPFVTYETIVSWLDYFIDQQRTRGPIPGKLSNRQRFDITVWSQERAAMGLIEIKYEPIMSAYSRTSDSKKLLGALKRWDSLRWGIFLFCVRNNTSKQGPVLRQHLVASAKKTYEAIENALSGKARVSLKMSDILRDQGQQVLWAGVIVRRLN